ncbi:MAG: hypothetical protein WCH65_04095 [bacterium]
MDTLAFPVKSFAVGKISEKVNVATLYDEFPRLSLTRPVLVCVHGCCVGMSNVAFPVHVLPSKL